MNALWLVGFCSFLSFVPVCAQTPGVPHAAGTGDRRIHLAVVVNDKGDAPVAGLQQQDFAVEDNKQARPIVSFQAIQGTRSREQPVEAILVLDAVNTGFERMAYERDQVKKFLQQDGGKLSVPVAIDLFTDTGLQLQNGASRDGNQLAAYLDQHETGLRTEKRSQGFYGAEDRTQLSLRALSQLAETEGQKPGRKLVVWVSPGWPLLSGPNVQLTNKDEQNIFNTVVATSSQLRQANITLYSVDPLGTTDSGTFRTFYYKEFLKGVTMPKQVQLGDLSLQVLADQSGGRVLNSNNNVAEEIARCVRDANDYYELSFEAPAGDGPDEYHAIQVKVDRPGLKAQTRSGYYAAPGERSSELRAPVPHR